MSKTVVIDPRGNIVNRPAQKGDFIFQDTPAVIRVMKMTDTLPMVIPNTTTYKK